LKKKAEIQIKNRQIAGWEKNNKRNPCQLRQVAAMAKA